MAGLLTAIHLQKPSCLTRDPQDKPNHTMRTRRYSAFGPSLSAKRWRAGLLRPRKITRTDQIFRLLIQIFRLLMMLGIEANHVIALRLMKLMLDRKGSSREAQLMISEQIEAALKAGASTLAGASSEEIIHQYRRRVAANKKRLGGKARRARRRN